MNVDAEDFLAWFVGPDDDETCDGCGDAVENNPYPADECPEPGDFECGSRCRHMVQLDDDAPDDLAPYEWTSSLGFGDSAGGAAPDLDALLSKDKITKDDVENFLSDNDLTMADLADTMDVDDYQELEDAMDDDATVDPSDLRDALASGDTDAAQAALNNGDMLADAIAMGKAGITDDVQAFTLADVLTDLTDDVYTPVLQGDKWIVTTGDLKESMSEGGAGSGNFGHAGRPGTRGGSAAGDDAVKEVADHYLFCETPGISQNVGIFNVRSQNAGKWEPVIRDEVAQNEKLDGTTLQYLGTGQVFDSNGQPIPGLALTLHPSAVSDKTSVFVNMDAFGRDAPFIPATHPTTTFGGNNAKDVEQYMRMTVDHEMGHVEWFNLSKPEQKKIVDGFYARAANFSFSQTPTISDYSKTNYLEYFAENYTAYVNGRAEFVSPEIKEILDSHLHGAKLHEAESSPNEIVAIADDFANCTSHVYYQDGHVEHHTPDASMMREGGSGSGNFGHAGRPGERGGSAAGDRKQAVFMIGGGSSGKGTAVSQFYGGMRHIDPDAIKKSEPLYTSKEGQDKDGNPTTPGLYGPSGPKTMAEYMTYPKDKIDAQEAWIRANTPFSSAIDFANNVMHNPNDLGGGLTHELSSYISKSELDKAIADGTKSFVYDSTGSEKYVDKADEARRQGFDITFHHVYAPVEKAVAANALRDRSVPEDLLRATHAKVARVLPLLRSTAKSQHYRWRYTDNTNTVFDMKTH